MRCLALHFVLNCGFTCCGQVLKSPSSIQTNVYLRRNPMQEQIMDLSGELDAEFEAYASSGQADVGGETMCTNVSCGTLQCTVLGCC